MSATPMNNKDYLWSYRAEALSVLEQARMGKGLTYEQIAESLGVNPVWLASAFDGQQWAPRSTETNWLRSWVSPRSSRGPSEHPFKGNVDPILYRLHEVFDTLDQLLKE